MEPNGGMPASVVARTYVGAIEDSMNGRVIEPSPST
jgi:hypothetical protein